MAIPAGRWRWFGHAGHFIGASRCLFHLHTRIGDYRISTVGNYFPREGDDEPTTVGIARLYETYVFRISGECSDCDPPCGQGEVEDWSEIDALPANYADAAEANHLIMCKKYAKAVG